MGNLPYPRDLALVGAGYWGKNLARNFHILGALHTLCDRNPEILASYGADYAGVRKSESFDAVLADPHVTCVAIAAPAALHYTLTKAALLAGKHVYVEKPLCLDVKEGEELVALSEQSGRILMVGHLLQYHPCIVELRRMLAAGELGRLQYLTSNRLNLGKVRKEENALWSFAPHDISVILALTDGRMPEQVRCSGESYLTPQVADTTLTTLRFADGIRGHIHVSWLNPFKEQKLTVVGSRGMVVFDDTKPWKEKLVVYHDYLSWGSSTNPTLTKVLGTPVVVPEAEPLLEECRHFLQCCRDRAAPRTDGQEALRVLRVLRAAQSSLDQDGEAFNPMVVPTPSYFVHPTAFVDDGAKVGAGTKIWHFSHVLSGAELGENCNLGQNVVVSRGVMLGRNVKVQNNVSIYTGVIVEDDVFLGPSCVLTNVSNPRSQVNRHSLYEKTLIRRGATVGANATIVCGVTLGCYCFIAAGAVVTIDVPDYAFVAGVPARRKGWMSRHGHRLNLKVTDDTDTCPESGMRYRLMPDGTVRCIDLPEHQSLPSNMTVGARNYREIKSEAVNRNRDRSLSKPS